MGLNNQINNINNSINSQTFKITEAQEKKQYLTLIKNEFISQLSEAKKDGFNLYDLEVQRILIKSFFQKYANLKYKDYYKSELYNSYFTLCNKIEKIEKMNAPKNDTLKDEIQAERLRIMKQKEADRQAKIEAQKQKEIQEQEEKRKKALYKSIKILLCILFAPVAFFLIIFGAVIYGASHTK